MTAPRATRILIGDPARRSRRESPRLVVTNNREDFLVGQPGFAFQPSTSCLGLPGRLVRLRGRTSYARSSKWKGIGVRAGSALSSMAALPPFGRRSLDGVGEPTQA